MKGYPKTMVLIELNLDEAKRLTTVLRDTNDKPEWQQALYESLCDALYEAGKT